MVQRAVVSMSTQAFTRSKTAEGAFLYLVQRRVNTLCKISLCETSVVDLRPMDAIGRSPVKAGLRERKKRQTRDNIARVALELFAERGYDETTLAEIADAADVAPRTIFAYFESKEDILLCEEVSFLGELKRQLDARPAGTTTVDTLREFLSHIEAPDEAAQRRKRVMTANPALKR